MRDSSPDEIRARDHAETPAGVPHGSTLTIDLDALVANWRLLAARAPGAEPGAVVKADAYGLGIAPITRALAVAGCRTVFVAHPSEAAAVRAVAPDIAIYVLNGLLPGSGSFFAGHRLRPVLGSREEIEEWSAFREASGFDGEAALHVDTGMNRLGLGMAEGLARAHEPQELVKAGITLLMTHFTSSEEPDETVNQRQIDEFEALRRAFPKLKASLLNSSGHFLPDAPPCDLTRPGYALYGGNPTPGRSNPMRPVIGLEATIIQVRDVPAGSPVGYNGKWTAPSDRRLATIMLGYADGYPRNASGTDTSQGGRALIGGVECPFVGTVSMDLVIVDVSDAPPGAVFRGAPVTLIGGALDLERVGAGAKTIGYEILTGLGRRCRRQYRGG